MCCKTKGQLAPSTMITFSRRPFQLAALARHQFGRDTMTPRDRALHAHAAGVNCIDPAQKAVACFPFEKKQLKYVHCPLPNDMRYEHICLDGLLILAERMLFFKL